MERGSFCPVYTKLWSTTVVYVDSVLFKFYYCYWTYSKDKRISTNVILPHAEPISFILMLPSLYKNNFSSLDIRTRNTDYENVFCLFISSYFSLWWFFLLVFFFKHTWQGIAGRVQMDALQTLGKIVSIFTYPYSTIQVTALFRNRYITWAVWLSIISRLFLYLPLVKNSRDYIQCVRLENYSRYSFRNYRNSTPPSYYRIGEKIFSKELSLKPRIIEFTSFILFKSVWKLSELIWF